MPKRFSCNMWFHRLFSYSTREVATVTVHLQYINTVYIWKSKMTFFGPSEIYKDDDQTPSLAFLLCIIPHFWKETSWTIVGYSTVPYHGSPSCSSVFNIHTAYLRKKRFWTICFLYKPCQLSLFIYVYIYIYIIFIHCKCTVQSSMHRNTRISCTASPNFQHEENVERSRKWLCLYSRRNMCPHL
jgi:hypothetical protein